MNDAIGEALTTWQGRRGPLLMLLRDVQNRLGYVPDEAVTEISTALDIPVARIYEVLTFYRDYRLTPPRRVRISVCTGTGCYLKGAGELFDTFERAVVATTPEVAAHVEVTSSGCLGACGSGPLVKVAAQGFAPVLYATVTPELAQTIMSDHVIPLLKVGTKPSTAFTLPASLEGHRLIPSLAICQCPASIVLRNLGTASPEMSVNYLNFDGYKALESIVTDLTPQEVVDQVMLSGLRGRGGAGFPTGVKFQDAYNQVSDEKFVICNADEGDPGGFIARYLLEGDPHIAIEGMAIAAYAIGAAKGWFYIRSDYDLAAERLEKALDQARARHGLGGNLFGTDFSFDCEIRMGAGAFVCGEETALIASIEGKRGTARPRPPYPTQSGLWGKPTCVNNIETLCALPGIIRMGAAEYATMGTPESPGTKLVALTGNIRNAGITEVPMGMSLWDIVNTLGGGTLDGDAIKAVHTGGPSGGVIPADALNTALCYKAFADHGFSMGDGAISVLSDNDDMVELATYFMEFSVNESCGRCAACRVGGRQILDLLKTLLNGSGTHSDIASIKRICDVMQKSSLCGLGQSAPNPVTSTLNYFEQEYLDKLVPKSCVEVTP